MIKSLFVFQLMLFAQQGFTQSQATLRLTCSTQPLTNSVVLYEHKDGSLQLGFLFHSGPERMVVHSGAITPADLDLI
jgi:hypothetical protein